MSIARVRAYFASLGIEDKIIEFDVSSATVALAAEALHCEPAHIAKSLAFYGKEDNETILVVAAGDAKVDNAKFRSTFGFKAKMLDFAEAEPRTGHAPGGVCPFAVNDGVRVYLDVSLKRFSLVYPAAGSANSAVPLTPAELEQYAKPLAWVDVCKGYLTE